jgi:dethiobiotin synthetase
VDVPAIDAALKRIGEQSDGVVIEGAGGWLCPLTDGLTFADWVATWRFPVLIVARPGLGTINHTLLTIEAIRRRGLTVAGVVFNAADRTACDDSTAGNVCEIEARTGVPVLGHIRHGSRELLQGMRSVRMRWSLLMG